VGFIRARRASDPLPRIGFWFAVTVLVALVVHRFVTIPLFGPVSWRFLYWVRLGLALAAIPALAAVDRRLARPRWQASACAVALALSLLWGVPLRAARPVPPASETEQLTNLWRWLEKNANPGWGRLYVQDTFGQEWEEGGMSASHALVLTSRYSRLPQIGTYYGVVPFRTRWTLSEFKSLFGTRNLAYEALEVSMDKTNTGAIVSSNKWTAAYLAKADFLEKRYEVGRYTVWLRQEFESQWVARLRPSNRVTNVEFRPGSVRFDLRTDRARGRVVAKVAWHPWWRFSGIPNAKVVQIPDGFLGIDGIPKGSFHVRLWYEPSALPAILSRVGAAGLLGWAIALFWRARRELSKQHPGSVPC
jgi:hypothetical protein